MGVEPTTEYYPATLFKSATYANISRSKADVVGIEPTILRVTAERIAVMLHVIRRSGRDSNPQPSVRQTDTLTN